MAATQNPSASIVLVCRNEAAHIAACLESILRQDPPAGGFEVLIADGMSTDGTREYLEQMAVRHRQIRVITNAERIVSTGLNLAIRAARSDIIIRMDAHTIYASDYVNQCLAVLAETGADNVGGPAQTTASTYWQSAIRAGFHSRFAVGGARSHDVKYEGWVDTVTYGCWNKRVFHRVGEFDPELVRNQDDEHNLRLVRAGGRIYQSPRIRSWYQVRGSLSALLQQNMQYGYWKVLVIKKHKLPASWRHVVPGTFVAALGLSALLACFWSPGLWGLAGLLSLYLCVAVLASFASALDFGWRLLPGLPLVFACFHIGYGYGFLRGLWDFVLFRNAPRREFVQLTRKAPGKLQPHH